MTKLFLTALDTTVDYTAGPESRTVINMVFFRISSNLVGGAGLQGYKIMAQDLALHMMNQGGEYLEEDLAMVGNYLVVPEEELYEYELDDGDDGVEDDPPGSAHQYLERKGFVQLATLNFMDAFVKCQVGGPPKTFPDDPQVNVELSVGLLHAYTCGDSLQSLQQTFGQWWAHVTKRTSQQPPHHAAMVEAANLASSGCTTETATTVSLEPMIKEDKFVPEVTASRFLRDYSQGNISESSSPGRRRSSSGGASHGGLLGNGLDLSKVMLVEDFYTVGQQPPPPALPPTSLVPEIVPSAKDDEDLSPEWQGGWIVDSRGALRGADIDDMDGLDCLLEVVEDDSGSLSTEVNDDDDDVSVMSDRSKDLPVWGRDDQGDDNDDGSEYEGGAVPGSLFQGMDMEVEMDSMGGLGKRRLAEDESDPLTTLAGMVAEAGEDGTKDEEEIGRITGKSITPVPTALMTEEPDELEEEGKGWHLFPGAWLVTSKMVAAWICCAGPPAGDDEDARIWRDHLPRDTEWVRKRCVLPHWQEIMVLIDFISYAPWLPVQQARWLVAPTEEGGDQMGPIKVYPHHIPQAVEDTSLPFASHFDPFFSPHAAATTSIKLGHIHFRLILHDLSVRWRVFGGHDWVPRTRSRTQEAVNSTAVFASLPAFSPGGGSEGEGRSRKHLENLLEDYGAPPPQAVKPLPARKQSRRAAHKKQLSSSAAPRQTKVGRDSDRMVELCLRHIHAKVDSYAPEAESELASSTSLSIKDLHVVDRINSLPQRKILGYW